MFVYSMAVDGFVLCLIVLLLGVVVICVRCVGWLYCYCCTWLIVGWVCVVAVLLLGAFDVAW